LPARKNPYWQPCGTARGGLSLGYRKPASGPGSWIARLICGGSRDEFRLGQADDAGAAPGALSFQAAVMAAMEWSERQAVANTSTGARDAGPLTVRAAVSAYVADRKARSARHGRDAETRLAKHLLASQKLADQPLAHLAEKELAGWVRGLTGLSQASVARLLNDTRAALNQAWEHHHRALPPGFRDTLTRGLRGRPAAPNKREGVQASHHRVALTAGDVRRLVEAAMREDDEGDFGRLVAVLAATGARFSQAARLRVADVMDGPKPRLMIPTSAKGRPGSGKAMHVAVPVAPDVVALLRPAFAGRSGTEPLLTKWRWRQDAGDKTTGRLPRWVKDGRVPWTVAADMARPWKRTVERVGLPPGTTPYRLRDASIIRGLNSALPVRLVAQLHDTSAAMIERHYASQIADALSDVAHAAVISIAPTAPGTLRAVP
jgi:integrase